MDYRDNWDKSMERLNAFMKGELIDRCCVSVIAPRSGKDNRVGPIPGNMEDRIKYWTDGEWILKRYEKLFENTWFGGDAFPQIWLNLGAAGLAGFFKNVRFQFEDTVWFFPCIHDWEGDSLEFDPESFLYKKTLELAKYFVNESKERFFVSMADISGNADAIAHLRGSDNLLMDLVTDRERIHSAMGTMLEAWKKVTGEVYDIVKDNNCGGSCIGWLDTWSTGRHDQLQCDLSVMISPRDFNEFIIPELEAQTAILDTSVYHFDGYEQIRHLDSILSLKRLSAIQWTGVSGQPSPVEFIPCLKKIQAAGKSLLLYASADEVEPLMEQLSSRGLYLLLRPSSEEEGRELLRKVEKLTHE